MSRYAADQNQVVFFYESGTYANTSGVGQWPGLIQDHTIDEAANVIVTRYVGGGTRDVSRFDDGPLDFTGTFTFFPQDWKFLGFALGSVVDAGSPSPYTHTISAVDSDVGNYATSGLSSPFVSFGIEDAQITAGATGTNYLRTLKGCMVDSMSISSTQGEPVSCEVTYRAQNVTFFSGAATAVTADTTRPFLWNDCQFHLPSGTKIDEVTDFDLTISNNLETPHYLNGSRVIGVPEPLNRDYELTLTLHGTTTNTGSLYEKYFRSGLTFNAMLAIDVTAGSRDCAMVFSGCKLIDMESPTRNEGLNEQTLTIRPQTMSVFVQDSIERYIASGAIAW